MKFWKTGKGIINLKRPEIIPVFTKEEYVKAHFYLASKVATMLGRKLEEGDWQEVYCKAKGIPFTGWSNLNIDVIHEGLGVEQKMLCVRANKKIKEYCGTSLMHPAATRSIRIPSTEDDATDVAYDVLKQYADLITERTKMVQETSGNGKTDMRVGWLLWQVTLQEFLYFEEEMLPPTTTNYYAEWVESGGGLRKRSKNLWVYEKETGKKRYSITTTAGAKIQPYFDVPPPNHPHLYYFRVQGELLENNLIRVWVTKTTAICLKQIFGELETYKISETIIEQCTKAKEKDKELKTYDDSAVSFTITVETYEMLQNTFEGVSDEHLFQQLINYAV